MVGAIKYLQWVEIISAYCIATFCANCGHKKSCLELEKAQEDFDSSARFANVVKATRALKEEIRKEVLHADN